MHSQNLKTVRDACIAANPSIMKLGFGCEVIEHFTSPTTNELIARNKVIASYSEGDFAESVGSDYENLYVPTLEILGRKIGLADVLLAIDARHDKPVWVFIGQNGQFKFVELHTGKESVSDIRWNLLQDDLALQSEPTVQFLAELLK